MTRSPEHQKFHSTVKSLKEGPLIYTLKGHAYVIPKEKEEFVIKHAKKRASWGAVLGIPIGLPVSVPIYIHHGRKIRKELGING